MSAVHVLAIITTKPGQRDALLELFNANVSAVLAEDGCIAYEATVDTANAGPMQTKFGPDTFVVIEKWASLAAHGAHAGSAHMKAHAASTRDMVADRVIHILSPT
ncbi:antibiotic biosynthesis monooxygenase [Sulfitobacter sp. JBTF-M27]|uniref:Antibiotic biosynthesis monooxygenase n=1 Tax=Sulfitobacter sediminilitoris TaxID=2698830 RepID=A0A6P0CG05_9RHOB|nr:putative quinol monooxygenase [Sulfitobacter sediminilitoris]NEK24857.1 antibiotic biosynthesis monooxygenase [Sulfitobacter sediminilitoris]